MKTITNKGGMMGVIIPKPKNIAGEWVTSGHWAYRAKYVKYPEEYARAFGRGESWATGFRSKIKPESLSPMLKPKGVAGEFTDLIMGHPDKSCESRLIIAKDRSTYALVRRSYLIEQSFRWSIKLTGPLEGVHFYDGNELQAVVMPMRFEDFGRDLANATAALNAVGVKARQEHDRAVEAGEKLEDEE